MRALRALLLALTGGLSNPFTVFLIAPAAIGAAAAPTTESKGFFAKLGDLIFGKR